MPTSLSWLAWLTWVRAGSISRTTPNNVPRIFTSETVVVSRGLVVEKAAQAKVAAPGEMLAGLDSTALPTLHGYLRVYGKPTAEMVMVGPDDDPLLAAWQYGSGRAVAYTSDFSNRWGREWIEWQQFPTFAGQLARWTMKSQSKATLQPRLKQTAGIRRFELEVWDRDEKFINGLDLIAHLQGPKGMASAHVMQQSAPGRYALELPNVAAGRYYVSVSRAGSAEATAGASADSSAADEVLAQARTFGCLSRTRVSFSTAARITARCEPSQARRKVLLWRLRIST